MIIEGRRAGNVGFWSMHLLRTDTNERAQVVEFRGVVATDLRGALREMQAVASASRCGEDFLYQANINPRAHEQLAPEQWRQAIDLLEKNLGFAGHARVVVEHVKEGRQHMHVVWCRVDEDLRTVSPYYNYKIHQATARALEMEFGLEPTPAKDRGRQPYALWEQERAAATKIDPRVMKAELTQLWRQADSGRAFAAAVAERGYVLARGDRRDFCIVDQAGTVHSLARRLEGVKAAELREVMGAIDRATLPSVAEARAAQRERFPEAGKAWESRPPLPAREREGGEDEEKRRPREASSPSLSWAARAGMVAQNASANRWIERAADRSAGAAERGASKLSPWLGRLHGPKREREKDKGADKGRDGPD